MFAVYRLFFRGFDLAHFVWKNLVTAVVNVTVLMHDAAVCILPGV